jgi:hypothetical protein
MAASNTRFTQNSLGQSKNPIDSDHGIYRGGEPISSEVALASSVRFARLKIATSAGASVAGWHES